MIQIRNVPEALHRSLNARAAMAGMSLSDYLLAEMRESVDGQRWPNCESACLDANRWPSNWIPLGWSRKSEQRGDRSGCLGGGGLAPSGRRRKEDRTF
jgi:plasmid stability protein